MTTSSKQRQCRDLSHILGTARRKADTLSHIYQQLPPANQQLAPAAIKHEISKHEYQACMGPWRTIGEGARLEAVRWVVIAAFSSELDIIQHYLKGVPIFTTMLIFICHGLCGHGHRHTLRSHISEAHNAVLPGGAILEEETVVHLGIVSKEEKRIVVCTAIN